MGDLKAAGRGGRPSEAAGETVAKNPGTQVTSGRRSGRGREQRRLGFMVQDGQHT